MPWNVHPLYGRPKVIGIPRSGPRAVPFMPVLADPTSKVITEPACGWDLSCVDSWSLVTSPTIRGFKTPPFETPTVQSNVGWLSMPAADSNGVSNVVPTHLPKAARSASRAWWRPKKVKHWVWNPKSIDFKLKPLETIFKIFWLKLGVTHHSS